MTKDTPAWLPFHSNGCTSCAEMTAPLAKLKPQYEGRVALILVDVDSRLAADQQLLDQYQVRYVPTTVLLSAAGQLVDSFVGNVSRDTMVAKLEAPARGSGDMKGAAAQYLLGGSNPLSLLSLTLALVVGVVTSLSPCNLSMVPILLGFLGAGSGSSRVTAPRLSLAFVAGTAVTYMCMGLVAGLVGGLFGASRLVLRVGASLGCIAAGASLAGLFTLPGLPWAGGCRTPAVRAGPVPWYSGRSGRGRIAVRFAPPACDCHLHHRLREGPARSGFAGQLRSWQRSAPGGGRHHDRGDSAHPLVGPTGRGPSEAGRVGGHGHRRLSAVAGIDVEFSEHRTYTPVG